MKTAFKQRIKYLFLIWYARKLCLKINCYLSFLPRRWRRQGFVQHGKSFTKVHAVIIHNLIVPVWISLFYTNFLFSIFFQNIRDYAKTTNRGRLKRMTRTLSLFLSLSARPDFQLGTFREFSVSLSHVHLVSLLFHSCAASLWASHFIQLWNEKYDNRIFYTLTKTTWTRIRRYGAHPFFYSVSTRVSSTQKTHNLLS
jgi:hypothetical protein